VLCNNLIDPAIAAHHGRDAEYWMIDATIVHAHQHSAGALIQARANVCPGVPVGLGISADRPHSSADLESVELLALGTVARSASSGRQCYRTSTT
jgi:hypothetical protein